MKKKYIKPTIIDLSIEGMTGFGFEVLSKNCSDGLNFLEPECNGGNGANPSCSGGASASTGCDDGQTPNDRGSMCWVGSHATGRTCLDGSNVSGQYAMCGTGGTGTISFDCNPAGQTANYCVDGISDVGGFS